MNKIKPLSLYNVSGFFLGIINNLVIWAKGILRAFDLLPKADCTTNYKGEEMKKGNFFVHHYSDLSNEIIETIAEGGKFRMERIISECHITPEDYWYDQDETEFVMVVKGRAELMFKGSEHPVDLFPGDYVIIEPHEQHRVTHTEESTFWIALFY